VKHNGPYPKALRERFFARVVERGDCDVWAGSRTAAGYGRFRTNRPRRMALAHRVSWEIHYGPVPDGMCVLHRCDNPPCVKPEHLWLGSIADNNQDMDAKGRRRARPLRGDHHPAAKLTSDEVRWLREHRPGPGPAYLLFGISKSAYYYALSGHTWRSVE
jgi:hypothetical protein